MEAEMVKASQVISTNKKNDRDRKIRPYDFRKPDKFSKEQIRTIHIMHETFSRLVSNRFSMRLRNTFEVKMNCVDQMTYEEFIRSIPNPTPMGIITMEPLKGSCLFEMDFSISSAIIDRLLGNQGVSSPESRDLTELDRAMVEPLFHDFTRLLSESWSNVVPLKARLGQLESSPQYAQIVPPTEMIILVSMKVTMGEASGFLNLCIPYLTLEPVIGRLSAQYWYSTIRKNRTFSMADRTIRDIKVDTEILTIAEPLSLKDLGELKRGSLVKLTGYNQKKGLVRMGGETVMTCDMVRGRNQTRYTLSQDMIPLEFHDKLEKDTPPKGPSLQVLSEQISRLFSDLSERLEGLSQNQEHLNDQVLLQGHQEQEGDFIAREPFAYLGAADMNNLYQGLQFEHRQLPVLLLSRLDSSLGALLLSLFDETTQAFLVKRLSKIERISPQIINVIDGILQKKFAQLSESSEPDLAGIEKVTEILNNSSRSVEKSVIETLEKEEGELAESIKKRMFVFEDIVLLEGKVVRALIDKVDSRDLILAIKTVEEEVREHIYSQLKEQEKKEITTGLEDLGRVRISDVDRAQQKIVSILRVMEEQGEVIIAHPGETVL
jgi:flagellar motor switch protein FliM